jgi:hypothetical protein
MTPAHNRNPKRGKTAKRETVPDQFSSDGQVEFRGGRIYLHQPLAGEVQGIRRRTGATLDEIVSKGLELVRKEVESARAAEEAKAAKVKKRRTQREKRAENLV